MNSHWGTGGRLVFGTLLGLTASHFAHAQWSSDPTNNLVISALDGGATQPKIVPVSDGGFYVSWLGNSADGYDVFVQRIDVEGRALWTTSVAARTYPLVIDYGLCVDADDNAYLAFGCCTYNAATEHIELNKVAPDGSLPWGANGKAASFSNRGVLNAGCAATTDGDVVAAWSQSGGVYAQKLDADGQPIWTQGGVPVSPSANINLFAHVGASTQGDAIVSWSDINGGTSALFAQKIASADGSTQWPSTPVFGAGNLLTLYYSFASDDAGGAVFWDAEHFVANDIPRVQHLDADGNPLLAANGVIATTDTSLDHTNTAGRYDASTGDIYVVWRDALVVGSRSSEGVSAQRIDSTGALMWSNQGKVLAPLADGGDETTISQLTALPAPDGFVASWVVGVAPSADNLLRATYLDVDGNAIWPSGTVDVKTTRETAAGVAAVSANGFFAYAWSDTESGSDPTIRAQNVNLDGSLGIPVAEDTIFSDGFDGG